jgi:serralysin
MDAGIDRVLDFRVDDGDRVLLDPGTVFTVMQIGGDTVIQMAAGQVILVGVTASSLPPGTIFGT